MLKKTNLIECPFCQGTLEIESQTGKIVGKWEKRDKTKPAQERFEEVLKREQESKKRLESYFGSAQAQMEEKKKKAENLFKEGLKKIKGGEGEKDVL